MRRHSETGNALFLILIAVVLFAALSYAITQSNRGGGGASKETASLAASSIMNYMSLIKMGHMRLSLQGFPSDVPAWNGGIHITGPRDAMYTNAGRIRANIFHPEGGGVSYMDAPIEWVNEVDRVNPTGNILLRGKGVKGVGSEDQEVVILLMDVKEKVCAQLNTMLSGSATVPALNRTELELRTEGNKIQDAGDVTLGQVAYCVSVSDTDKYYFYYVIAEDAAGYSPY